MAASSREGPVSRYLNRRLSQPLARMLAPTPVTPNAVSIFSCLIALGALACFAVDQPIAAGVLIQASSVVDGVDGDLARLQGSASRFGGVLDAVLDRYADAAIVGGMAWYAWAHPESSGPAPLVVGLATMTAFFIVSYSRARFEDAGFGALLGGPAMLASRDVRLLLAAIGSALAQAYWAMVAIGAAAALVVAWRFVLAYAPARPTRPIP